MFYHLCRTQGRTLVYILCHMCIHFDQIPRFSHTFQMDDRVVCKLNHLEKTNKNIFFFGQRGSYNCLFFSLTSQQPIKGSKFFVPMEIVEKDYTLYHQYPQCSSTPWRVWKFWFLVCKVLIIYNPYTITAVSQNLIFGRVRTIFFLFCWCPIFRQKISTSRIIIISFIAVAWTRQPLVLSHNTLSSGKRQKECCVTGVLCERNPPPVERVLYDKSVVWKSRALCNKENALRDKIKHRLHRRLALNQFI